MKTTTKKPSPLKFDAAVTASLATKEGRASYEASRPKRAVTRNTSAKDAATANPRSASAAARARARAKAPETSIKTTKPSPIKFFQPVTVGKDVIERVSNASKAAADRVKAKKNATTKTPDGKPSTKPSAPRGPLARAKAKAETSVKTTTTKSNPAGKPSAKPTATETSVKAPTMQLKKAGMKKKC